MYLTDHYPAAVQNLWKETIMKHFTSLLKISLIILLGLFVVACNPSVTAVTTEPIGLPEITATSVVSDLIESPADICFGERSSGNLNASILF